MTAEEDAYRRLDPIDRLDLALAFALFGYPAETVTQIAQGKPQGISPSPRTGYSGREQ